MRNRNYEQVEEVFWQIVIEWEYHSSGLTSAWLREKITMSVKAWWHKASACVHLTSLIAITLLAFQALPALSDEDPAYWPMEVLLDLCARDQIHSALLQVTATVMKLEGLQGGEWGHFLDDDCMPHPHVLSPSLSDEPSWYADPQLCMLVECSMYYNTWVHSLYVELWFLISSCTLHEDVKTILQCQLPCVSYLCHCILCCTSDDIFVKMSSIIWRVKMLWGGSLLPATAACSLVSLLLLPCGWHRVKMKQAYDFALEHVGIDFHSTAIWADYIHFLKSEYVRVSTKA